MAAEKPWDAETTRLLRAIFAEEANEHISVMEEQLSLIIDDPGAVREVLRRAHTLKGSAGTVGFRCVQDAAHALEDLLISARDGGHCLSLDSHQTLQHCCALLRGMVGAETLSEAERLLSRFNGQLGTVEFSAAAKPPAARVAVEPERRKKQDRRTEELHVIRVDVERIDEMMNSVGQLVIERTRMERRLERLKNVTRRVARLQRSVGDTTSTLDRASLERDLVRLSSDVEWVAAGLTEEVEQLQRTTRRLQERLTRVRKMSVRWLFARLKWQLADLCSSQDKQAELRSEGDDAELDRSLLERISDPLFHLVRNAVAHGIEPPAERVAAGKSACGTVCVSVKEEGELLVISVADDGAGVDTEAVRNALDGLDLGVATGGLDDEGLLDCIFLSGFSTRRAADSLAGRGLGLEVVRRTASALGGDVSVRSRPGLGTTFTMQLPLTRSITHAVLIGQGESVYAVPVAYLLETVVLDGAVATRAMVDGELEAGCGVVPLLSLETLLGEGGRPQAALVLSFGDSSFALGCERVIGPQEIVFKSLEPLLAQLPFFIGATVGPRENVQFILDVAALARRVHWQRPRTLSSERSSPAQSLEARDSGVFNRKLRILVVDDSRSVRQVLMTMLQSQGHLVELAGDGERAWENLERYSFDVLVTDLEMPQLHGLGLIARCRRESRLAGLRILVLSSRAAARTRDAARQAGADCFLAKPLNRRLMLDTVARFARELA